MKLSLRALGTRAGLSNVIISLLERGIQTNPKPETIVALERALDVKPGTLTRLIPNADADAIKEQRRQQETMAFHDALTEVRGDLRDAAANMDTDCFTVLKEAKRWF